MYVSRNQSGRTLVALFSLVVPWALLQAPAALGQGIIENKGIVQKITASSDRLEMTVNTSQILTLGSRIPRIVVNNPELLGVTALSATEVQVSAKKVGVTSINLWDENNQAYSVDVTILGDARELELALQTQFPNSAIKVYRYSNALVLKGFVDRPDHISQIQALAEDYAPKVINNISVGGVHEIMLKVKVMEVSRTKLRELGFDWDWIIDGGFVSSFVGDIANTVSETFRFRITSGNDSFTGFLAALEQHDLAKILAEPVLTTVSGRPAKFLVGGEFPILIPQSLGTVTIDYKDFGTRVDFLPVVLGNGNIRLEVRPRVSELDETNGVFINGTNVPALRVREIDTGVELKAGQTLALAGLVQQRVVASSRGLPVISQIPYLGVPFRRVRESVEEVELLILVTPEFVDAMDPQEVPPCGPGMYTTSPSSCELYMHGYLEVPSCPPNGAMPGGGVYDPSMGVMQPAPGGPAIEQVPSGLNGSEGYLPEAVPGAPGAPPAVPLPQTGASMNRLPASPVTLPSVEATPYQFDRNPSYIRDNSYEASDQPPGPLGPIGYELPE
jgi:pilus assembly protein CpaC